MNPFWESVVKLMPKSLAPNTITFIGVVVNLVAYFSMFYYDQTLMQEVPAFTYLNFSLGLFIYQTLDAIDGKQARRTGSSSPLGQLFDHGCDTLSCSLLALALDHTLQLGLTWKGKLLIGSLWFPFYTAQLLELHVGMVRTHVGNIGVTEGQLGQCAIMMIAFIMGGRFYDRTLVGVIPALSGVVPDYVILSDIVVAVVSINSIFFGLYLVYEMFIFQKEYYWKFVSIMRMLPVMLCLYTLYLLDPKDTFTYNNAALMIIALGLVFTLLTTKVIVSSMARMQYSFFQIEAFLFAGYFYFQYFYNGKDQDKLQKYSFIITFVVILALYLKLVRTVIIQITNHLGIYCFSIKKPKED